MKKYLASLELAAILGFSGCDSGEYSALEHKAPAKPVQTPEYPTNSFYLDGTVKGERFQDNFFSSSEYFCALETTNGFVNLVSFQDGYAPVMDSMINPTDRIKVEFKRTGNGWDVQPGQKRYAIRLDQVVEINGKKIR